MNVPAVGAIRTPMALVPPQREPPATPFAVSRLGLRHLELPGQHTKKHHSSRAKSSCDACVHSLFSSIIPHFSFPFFQHCRAISRARG